MIWTKYCALWLSNILFIKGFDLVVSNSHIRHLMIFLRHNLRNSFWCGFSNHLVLHIYVKKTHIYTPFPLLLKKRSFHCLLHCGLKTKYITIVWLLPCVKKHVLSEITCPMATVLATNTFLFHMGVHFYLQAFNSGTLITIRITVKKFFFSVCVHEIFKILWLANIEIT